MKKLSYSDIHNITCSTDNIDFYTGHAFIKNISDKCRQVYFGGENFPPPFVFQDSKGNEKEERLACLEKYFEKLYNICDYKSFVTMGITSSEKESVEALMNLRHKYNDIEIEVTMTPYRLFPLIPNYDDLFVK